MKTKELEQKLIDVMQALHDLDTDRLAESRRSAAAYMALLSIVSEIAAKHGISDAEFVRHWGMRKASFYQHFIEQAAKLSPELAEAIDERSPNAARPKLEFPPLIP